MGVVACHWSATAGSMTVLNVGTKKVAAGEGEAGQLLSQERCKGTSGAWCGVVGVRREDCGSVAAGSRAGQCHPVPPHALASVTRWAIHARCIMCLGRVRRGATREGRLSLPLQMGR